MPNPPKRKPSARPKRKPLSDAVAIANDPTRLLNKRLEDILTPEPFIDPVFEPTEDQQKVIERIEHLEGCFIAEASGKKRYRIRRHIEALELQLSRENLQQHNDALREQLREAHDALNEMKAQVQEVAEYIRTATP